MVFDKFGKDSTYLYLCFPKTIIYDNKTDALHLVERYSVDRHHSGRNLRDYRLYRFRDSLIYPKKFKIPPYQKDSFNIYYGYLLKIDNLILNNLLDKSLSPQSKGENKVYDIPINTAIKKWAISKVNDSIKGKIHFKLHNKEKGFFYKSLDIELFED
ncbi:hypothetical protein ACSTS3_21645 [Aquimarina muelleri]|uniref:hypothetical protein n=1 Tax=Aquimarina muelleri TaxID=279356 RepID=UPI003F685DA1